jgi:hypothetical protein
MIDELVTSTTPAVDAADCRLKVIKTGAPIGIARMQPSSKRFLTVCHGITIAQKDWKSADDVDSVVHLCINGSWPNYRHVQCPFRGGIDHGLPGDATSCHSSIQFGDYQLY